MSPQTARKLVIYLHDDYSGPLTDRLAVGILRSKIEISMFIHGSHLQHGYCQGLNVLTDIARQLRIPYGGIIYRSLAGNFAIHSGKMPGMPDKRLFFRIHIHYPGAP